jgi:hypothetical protein
VKSLVYATAPGPDDTLRVTLRADFGNFEMYQADCWISDPSKVTKPLVAQMLRRLADQIQANGHAGPVQ